MYCALYGVSKAPGTAVLLYKWRALSMPACQLWSQKELLLYECLLRMLGSTV